MYRYNTIQYNTNSWFRRWPDLSTISDVALIHSFIHSFIHSLMCCGYFYSASSSPLLLRGIPDYSNDTVSELTRRSAAGKTTSEGLAQVPYVAARVGFEPATFRTQGTEPTTKPRRPMML